MATINEDKIMRSNTVIPAKNNDDVNANTNSWAERSEGFLSNLKSKNAFDDEDDGTRFYVIKRKEGDFIHTSPFLIQKSIQSVVGEPKAIKKLRSGELLIELINSKQVKQIKKCTSLSNIPVEISAHRTLNSCRGVISESELQYVSEEELLENLNEQKVTSVKRISIFREGKKIPTRHIILTFGSTTLPTYIKAGYLKCNIRPYIPNPLRCFNCQRFGHSKTSCRGQITCARCGVVGHENSNCTGSFNCVNCKQDHPSYSKNCEKWKTEKEIQTVRTKQNISYPEARKIVDARTPKKGISYANAAAPRSMQKTLRSIETQTDFPTTSNSELKTPTALPQKPSITPTQFHKDKPPLHKRTNNNKESTKQHNKTNNTKNLPFVKSTVKTTSKSKKPTTGLDKTKQKLKDVDAVSLHPTDSSDSDDMEIAPEANNADVFI